jgi:hypothetical protein
MPWAVLIPCSLSLAPGTLRQKAEALAGSSSKCWWERRGNEFAICFENGNAAVCSVVYCITQGIQPRTEWPKIEK